MSHQQTAPFEGSTSLQRVRSALFFLLSARPTTSPTSSTPTFSESMPTPPTHDITLHDITTRAPEIHIKVRRREKTANHAYMLGRAQQTKNRCLVKIASSSRG